MSGFAVLKDEEHDVDGNTGIADRRLHHHK
jgi:hypothetical protein